MVISAKGLTVEFVFSDSGLACSLSYILLGAGCETFLCFQVLPFVVQTLNLKCPGAEWRKKTNK